MGRNSNGWWVSKQLFCLKLREKAILSISIMWKTKQANHERVHVHVPIYIRDKGINNVRSWGCCPNSPGVAKTRATSTYGRSAKQRHVFGHFQYPKAQLDNNGRCQSCLSDTNLALWPWTGCMACSVICKGFPLCGYWGRGCAIWLQIKWKNNITWWSTLGKTSPAVLAFHPVTLEPFLYSISEKYQK